jgi:hypothetical protein
MVDQLDRVTASVAIRESETDQVIRIRDILLWVGVRVIAELQQGEPLSVSPAIGQRALDLFEDFAPPARRREILRDYMIQWLRRCADAGWQILFEKNAGSAEAALPNLISDDS